MADDKLKREFTCPHSHSAIEALSADGLPKIGDPYPDDPAIIAAMKETLKPDDDHPCWRVVVTYGAQVEVPWTGGGIGRRIPKAE
jgi:hypothetical protein